MTPNITEAARAAVQADNYDLISAFIAKYGDDGVRALNSARAEQRKKAQKQKFTRAIGVGAAIIGLIAGV